MTHAPASPPRARALPRASGPARAAARRAPLAALLVAAAALFAAAAPAAADWRLADDRYQAMDPFERSQYDKAARLFDEGEYRAAAAEFGKFMSQHGDCVNLSYMVLMQGRSMHLDNKRHRAIEIYDQVIDYFAHVDADAAAAMYYKGLAYIANGDVVKGVATLRGLVEHERFRDRPVVAGALRRLADYYAGEGRWDRAVTYWKQTVEDFAQTNVDEAKRARANVTEHYIALGDYEAYESWILAGEEADDPERRRWASDYAWGQAYHRERQWRNQIPEGATVEQRRRAFFDYFTAREDAWVASDRRWDYFQHAINYAVHRLRDGDSVEALVDGAVAATRELDSAAARDDRYDWLADRLKRGGHFARARYCLDQMSDQMRATYGRYELLARQKQWQQAADVLQQLIAAGKGDWPARAERQLANVYRVHLNQQDEAIELYRKVNDPPATIWAISDAYVRKGELDKGLSMLVELENSFPAEAPDAAWKRVSLLAQKNRDDRAIAEARRILKVYPKSRESSAAHQFLEKRGIATGGAVIDEN